MVVDKQKYSNSKSFVKTKDANNNNNKNKCSRFSAKQSLYDRTNFLKKLIFG